MGGGDGDGDGGLASSKAILMPWRAYVRVRACGSMRALLCVQGTRGGKEGINPTLSVRGTLPRKSTQDEAATFIKKQSQKEAVVSQYQRASFQANQVWWWYVCVWEGERAGGVRTCACMGVRACVCKGPAVGVRKSKH